MSTLRVDKITLNDAGNAYLTIANTSNLTFVANNTEIVTFYSNNSVIFPTSTLIVGTQNVVAQVAAAINVNNQANAAYNQANTAYNQANTAYNQANTAYNQANAAYNQANTAGFPKNYFTGFNLENDATDATNDIVINTGACRSDDDAENIVLSSAITKRLDAAWAVGSGEGGLDTGSIANTTYHLWAIKRTDTGVVDVLFSTSASSPTMPANYTKKCYLWPIVRVSAAIRKFLHTGNRFDWDVPVQDVSASNGTTNAVTRTLTVPTGVKVHALLVGVYYQTNATRYGLITSLDTTDTAPSSSIYNLYSETGLGYHSALKVRTNTSAQVRSRVSDSSGGSNSITINTLGFVYNR